MPDERGQLVEPPTNPSQVPDAVLDQLAIDIAALHRKTTLGFALQIGRMVVDRLYAGNLETWRARAGTTDGSFRILADKLQQLGSRGLSATTLQQAVATLDLEERVGVSGRPQLTASHVRAVLGLPAEKQEQLLGTAESKDWSVVRLQKAVDKARAALATRPGRPRLPGFVRTVNRWERELADQDTAFSDLDQAGSLKPDEAKRLRATVTAMRDRCSALLDSLPKV